MTLRHSKELPAKKSGQVKHSVAGRKPPARGSARASTSGLPKGYARLLADLKTRIRTAQVRAVLSVNRELIQLYWDIGKLIVDRQQREGWGQSVIERLSRDVRKSFPGLQGFSRTNIFRMRAFYLAYAQDLAKVPQAVGLLSAAKIPQPVGQLEMDLPAAVAEIPWGHNAILIEKIKDPLQRLWYACKTSEHGWSRPVLTVQIETDLYGRQGQAVNNFAATLPPPQSDLAQQTLKDPYLLDFLNLSDEAHERDLESGLVTHVRNSSSSWASASPSSAGKSRWTWTARSFLSTCSSIT